MKMSRMVGRTLREDPRDAKTASHRFLQRGGYVRPVSAGIYSLLPLGKRVVAKVERIIREEMNAVEGQEVLMPVVLPAELWQESGRYASVGAELLRFKDRNDKEMLLGMTHEEAVVHLCRSEVNSHRQLPVMLYQIQTKYRDEARPRAGLIRVREFTMKDAYSFHADDACLDGYYPRVHAAYERIFRRVGLPAVLSIESDSGFMGGSVSHEFMALAECGEDTLFVSPDGSYRANREVAVAAWDYGPQVAPQPLEKVATPGKTSIEEVAAYLGLCPADTGKAVFYLDGDGALVFAMIRGDFEVNEAKLRNHLRSKDLKFADDARIRACGAEPGYASPLALDPAKVRIVVDGSVAASARLVVGANEPDHHLRNFNLARDLPGAEVVDIACVREGDPCPRTGQPLQLRRGIEVGNIFKLGTKYSAAMHCLYLDAEGKSRPMVMGCYGIGVGRTMASVVEQCHDEYGPVWPVSIAPYEVQVCAVNPDKAGVRAEADALYAELQAASLEVLYDDRGEAPGSMFSDADLIGAPFRLTVSPKTLAAAQVEFKRRGAKDREMLPRAGAVSDLVARVAAERAKFA